MKKLLKFVVCLALLVMVVALFTGCKVTGGGSFMNSGDEKVTFGFNAQGTETDEGWAYKGQFQAVNHGQKEKIHINDMLLLEVIGPVANFTGWDKKLNSIVNVTVTDLGEPGPGPGDLILIASEHGIWGGVVQGEIQVHKDKEK